MVDRSRSGTSWPSLPCLALSPAGPSGALPDTGLPRLIYQQHDGNLCSCDLQLLTPSRDCSFQRAGYEKNSLPSLQNLRSQSAMEFLQSPTFFSPFSDGSCSDWRSPEHTYPSVDPRKMASTCRYCYPFPGQPHLHEKARCAQGVDWIMPVKTPVRHRRLSSHAKSPPKLYSSAARVAAWRAARQHSSPYTQRSLAVSVTTYDGTQKSAIASQTATATCAAQSAHMLVIMLNAYPHGFAVCFVAPHVVSGALSFGQYLVWCERVRV